VKSGFRGLVSVLGMRRNSGRGSDPRPRGSYLSEDAMLEGLEYSTGGCFEENIEPANNNMITRIVFFHTATLSNQCMSESKK
jgi:hypothetical protein